MDRRRAQSQARPPAGAWARKPLIARGAASKAGKTEKNVLSMLSSPGQTQADGGEADKARGPNFCHARKVG